MRGVDEPGSPRAHIAVCAAECAHMVVGARVAVYLYIGEKYQSWRFPDSDRKPGRRKLGIERFKCELKTVSDLKLPSRNPEGNYRSMPFISGAMAV